MSASVEENDVQNSPLFKPVFDFANRHPHITLLTGIETFKVYGDQKATSTARFDESSGIYYDDLNAAVSIKSGDPLLFYTKSKLVPGVETLPSFLGWMGAIFEQFGGTAVATGILILPRCFASRRNLLLRHPLSATKVFMANM